jgi:hypothetical protein
VYTFAALLSRIAWRRSADAIPVPALPYVHCSSVLEDAMAQFRDLFNWQIHLGPSIGVNDIILTPQSQALTIRWLRGGLVWNRPLAILIQQGEHMERIPVIDVTRVVQLGLLSLTVVFSVVWIFLSRRRD